MIEPLRMSFVVACPADHAFAVWTQRASSWWPVTHTVTGERGLEVVFECRPGGRIFERTRAGDGGGDRVRGPGRRHHAGGHRAPGMGAAGLAGAQLAGREPRRVGRRAAALPGGVRRRHTIAGHLARVAVAAACWRVWAETVWTFMRLMVEP